jgi:uncharacterized membrane protein (DUF4010 family)
MENMENYIDIALAIALALLVGLERGWHLKDEDEGKRIAGIRTFTVVGIFASLSSFFSKEVAPYFIMVAFGGVSIVVSILIFRTRNEEDRGITTEISLLTTFIISTLAAYGYRYIASASAVLMVILLSLKPQIHSFVKRIAFDELIALLKFLVLISIIYPILPNTTIGGWTSITYTDIFKIVIILSAISFLGYVAVKIAGPKKGVILSSLMGGLVSSTAVTINLSNYFRQNNGSPNVYTFGILLSWVVMFFRVVILTWIFNWELLIMVIPIILSMVMGVLIYLYIIKKDLDNTSEIKMEIKNPIEILSSIKFALLLSAIIFLAEKGKEEFGKVGVLVISVFSGISDVDAITVYLSKLSIDNVFKITSVIGIFLAVIVNTLVKCCIATYVGSRALGSVLFKVTFMIVLFGIISIVFVLYIS